MGIAQESLDAASISCSAICSSIGFGFENFSRLTGNQYSNQKEIKFIENILDWKGLTIFFYMFRKSVME